MLLKSESLQPSGNANTYIYSLLTLESREDLVRLEGHEVHDLQVRDPELGQDVDIDCGHGELVPHRPVS